MKKLLFFALTLLLAASCKEAPRYTITGNTGKGGDTLYLFGLDSRYEKIEKIACDKQGTFTHTVKTDTIAPLGLVMPSGELITLFAEPNVEAQLLPDSIKGEGWIVKGGREQALYDSIAGIIAKAESNSQKQVHIEAFTRSHPMSNVNVEIIRRFMVDIPQPNNNFILSRIRNLGGTLQDHEFFTEMQERTDSRNSNIIYKMLPSFSYTTADGKKVTQKRYREKMLIVNFWAAWDSLSRKQMKEISRQFAGCDTSRMSMLNISLDYDTALWRSSITRDSIAGDNVCDGKAWYNDTAKRFNISSLPFTLIASPYQRIDLFGLTADQFTNVTDSLSKKYFKEKDKKLKRNSPKRR